MSGSADMHNNDRDDRLALCTERDRYVARLHLRPDDFEATRGLARVIARIGRLPEQRPVITGGG
jgi:hypothetical protein